MSRFVSAGTDDEPSERDEAWLKAQAEIEAKRGETAEAGKQDGGKTLYETLQANKAAKQEAFEESIRLKNQFRSLDEDEVEFLDSVLESTRAKEAEVKKETNQQLDAFRRQQVEAEEAANQEDATEPVETEAWRAGPRKRKRDRENAIGGMKIRRTSTAEKESNDANQSLERSDRATFSSTEMSNKVDKVESSPTERNSPTNIQPQAKAAPKVPLSSKAGLGLAAYSSDEED